MKLRCHLAFEETGATADEELLRQILQSKLAEASGDPSFRLLCSNPRVAALFVYMASDEWIPRQRMTGAAV